jgi:cytochrome P450
MGGGMSEHLLREQVKTFLTAGHESSALALTWAFVLLAEHPAVRAALTEELRSALNGRSPACRDQPRLPYTLAVVQETLRLYPPLWMTGRESTRACDIGGTHVPAGGLIMTSQWAVQRLLRYFPQPDEFRPERWINGETADLPRHAYFPFGGGPRICIAHSFALMESVLILAAIAQRFDLELLPGPEIRPTAAMTLRPSRQVIVRLHKSGVTAPLPA